MDETTRVSRLIGDIYDAALDPALWPRVLEETCGFVNGLWCSLLAQDSVEMKHTFFVEWGADPYFTRQYDEVYAKLNPIVVPTMLYAKVGSVISVADLIPLNEFRESRFNREWLAPQGIVDAISATLDKSPTSYAVVSLSRHESHGMIDDDARRRMGLLGPHFRRAVTIGKVIDLHKVEAATLADTLDGLATAMFLVDASGRIVQMNSAGHAMLAESCAVRALGGKLTAVNSRADYALHEIFANADGGDLVVGVSGIALSLGAHKGENFVAHVLPLTSGVRRKAAAAYSAVAAVFVRKAALDLPHPVETLAGVFKLTPAEMRVMMAIVQIGGVPEVAPVLGISETTVKTHLQRIFQKTGTTRQADLVKLVAGYLSPLG